MGFTVYYESISPVSSDLQAKLEEAAEARNKSYAWTYCEPVGFFDLDDDGRLTGGSKPALGRSGESRRRPAMECGRPHGTLNAVVEILCDLSRTYGVDWGIAHDFADAPIGYIYSGSPTPELVVAIQQIPAMVDER